MIERLELILKEYELLIELLSSEQVINDYKKTTELLKKTKSIENIVEVYKKYKVICKEVLDLTNLINSEEDEQLVDLARVELFTNNELKERLEEDLKILLLPKDKNDEKNCIFEIRGAAGGDEANIFAGDLFRMYVKYASLKNWKVEVVDSIECNVGGYTYIEFMVSGENVYSSMKYESGSHRVQRVPVTESNGRIQTSTATVLVMIEADDIDVELKMEDVRIDTFCSSGHGGQSVNTTKSAVRLTHIPTNLVVSCQDGKSQHENKANAFKVLRSRLYDKILTEIEEKEEKDRLSKIGRGNRSEKIRTYNYPQNRVTDHRINYTTQALDRVMEGDLDSIITNLINYDQTMKLKGE